MIQTSLSTIKEIESRKDPAVIMNEIFGRLIQPIFRDIIRYITIEANQARDTLNELVPREHHATVDLAIKEIVKGIGKSTSGDYRKTVEILAKILECKPEDEKVRPMLRSVPKEEDEQQEFNSA